MARAGGEVELVSTEAAREVVVMAEVLKVAVATVEEALVVG